MENRGLVFIPDISGFTRFIHETEIEHSRMIIQELLEILINSNQIGLQVSEIEGDAILFYKFGDAPSLKDLFKQVEQMFCDFHRNLNAYQLRKYCQCTACVSAGNLTLKIITHYGEFTGYTVKNFSKLIGKDIIVAHQLLKNDIDQYEYWLVTQPLLRDDWPAGLAQWMKWERGAKQTENGDVAFQYTQLGQLKDQLSPEQFPTLDLSTKTKVISVSGVYDTDIITLFHASGNFRYRSRWQVGVQSVEELSHYLPRLGMRCRCNLNTGDVFTYVSSYYQYQDDRIEFAETNEKNKQTLYFTLEEIGIKKTRLTIDLYLNKSIFAETFFRLIHKEKRQDDFNKSLQNLVPLVQELRIPTAKV